MKRQIVGAALVLSAAACGNISEPLKNVEQSATIVEQEKKEARDLRGLRLSALHGRIDGDIGFFTGVHESAPQTEFYADGYYTQLTLQSTRADGSFGFAALMLNSDIADMPVGEPQLTTQEESSETTVVGCASTIDAEQYYDMPADEVSVTVDVPDDGVEVPQGEEAVAELTFLAHWDDYGPTMPEQTVKGRVILTAPVQ